MIGASKNIWGFDPRTIPGCALWLDPADTSTVTLNGSNVSQLRDKSGLGYNMSQSTAGNQPTYSTALNGNRMLTFTQASSTRLSNVSFPAFIGPRAASYFLVEYNMTGTGNPGPFGYSAGPNFGIIMQYNAGFTGGLQPFQSGITSFTSGTPRLTFLYKANNGTNMIGFVNGTSQSVSDSTSGTYSGTFSVGSGPNGFISGNICELIIFNTVLTTAQRQQIEGYLAWKWQLQTSIPTTHPYLSLRPHLQYFQPTNIPGCELWFDGGDYRTMFQNTAGTTPVTAAEQSVARWNDKIRNLSISNTGVPGQSLLAPTSVSGGGVFFNNISSVVSASAQGLGTSLTGATNQTAFLFRMPNRSMTMITASLPLSNNNLRQICCIDSSPNGAGNVPNFAMGHEIGAGNGGTILFDWNGSAWGQIAQSTSGYNSNTVLRIDSLVADSNPIWLTNGTSNTFTQTNTYTTANSNYPVNRIGMGGYSSTFVGSRNFHGNIYEMLFYSRVLTTGERQQVEGYLAHKWGITSSLPTTHPYKTIPTAAVIPRIGSLSFNGTSNDAFIVKYDPNGTPLWARKIGGTIADQAASVIVDSSGKVIVVGQYTSIPVNIYDVDGLTVFFTLTNSASSVSDVFVVKYDSSGTPLWARRIGGTGNDFATSVTTDSSENIVVTGHYRSTSLNVYAANGTTVSFTLTNTSEGGSETFIVKYDFSGTPLWTRKIGGLYNNIVNSVKTDLSGNVIVVGEYSSPSVNIFAANGTTVSFTLSNNGGNDTFVVKYDSSGTPLWARKMAGTTGGLGFDVAYSVSTDSSGNIVVAGSYTLFSMNVYAANGTTVLFTLSGSGYINCFVVKYDSSGTPLWARKMGDGTAQCGANSVSIDSSGNIVVAGFTGSSPMNIFAANGTTVLFTLTNNLGGDAFVVKYDSGGTPLWARKIGGTNDDEAKSVSTDSRGNVIVVGRYTSNPLNIYAANQSTVLFMLSFFGVNDAFVVKYDSGGTPLWARRLGGAGNDIANSVSTDLSGNIVVVGEYASNQLSFYT